MYRKLFYFSGTGNTLYLAKELMKKIEGMELVKIRHDMDFNCKDCDIAGIAYPVYCFTLPKIVVDFINKIQFSSSIYIFGLASYGGLLTSSGRNLKKMLNARGYTLNAGFAIKMPGNATHVYEVPSLEKREAMYSKVPDRIAQIASIVNSKGSYGIDTNLGILGRLASVASKGMMSKINESDKVFLVDSNCDSCGICSKVCPVGNIKIIDGKPQWQHRCESCLACFHWCPKASIQIGKKTASRNRYHHPKITLEDIVPQTKTELVK